MPTSFFFPSFRNFLSLALAVCLSLWGGMACIGGSGGIGGGGGGEIGGGEGPNIASVVPPPGGITNTNQAAPTMPDIAVGPLPDVVLDPNALKGPKYAFRVYGTALTVCHSTETETVNIQQIAPQSKWIRLFEGTAYAAPDTSNLSSAELVQNTITVHRLKVAIKGQVQFNVDGGPFYDWKPSDNLEPVIRAMDPYNNVVDTKIKEAGNIELNFLLRLASEPSAEGFDQAMQDLHFYRTPSNFPTTNLDVQKTCDPSGIGQSACKFFIPAPLKDIQGLAPAQPNYGASTDFAGVPECPAS